MTIAREEIFGPVLSIMPLSTTRTRRSGSPTTPSTASPPTSPRRNLDHARAVAARLRAGTVNLNYPAWDVRAPFGGFKQSGNGREYAGFGIDDYLEWKAVVGHG